MNGGLILGGNGPEGFKTAKVIEPDNVVQCMGTAHAVHPPVEAPAFQHLPLVDRVAPALAGRAEIVRGHTGNANRSKVFAQLKNFRVGPHIGAVVVDEDSHVANEADVALRTVAAQGFPLLIEGELYGLLDFEIVPALLLQLEQRLRIPVGELLRPGQPVAGQESLPQNTVASVIRQPEGILFTEALEAGPLLVVVVGQKVTRGLEQKRPLTLFHFFKVHVSSMARKPGDAVRRRSIRLLPASPD